MFIVILLGDVPNWITEPNWVEYATSGGGLLVLFYTVFRAVQRQQRRNNLIVFPDNWRIERNLRDSEFKTQLRAHVYAPYTSVHCEGTIRVDKRPIRMTDSHLEQTMGVSRDWILELKAGLDAIPEDVDEVEDKLTVTLDDGTKRDSGWRTSPITVWPTPEPPSPDKAASQG